MKFQSIWEQFAKENSALKFALACQFIVIGSISLCLVNVNNKPPLVIERSCTTTIPAAGDLSLTKKEVEAFTHEALLQRFDSRQTPNKEMFAASELNARIQEQKEFAKRNIKQRLLINSVSVNKLEQITVDADRILSVDAVRSAFASKLQIAVATTARTAANPYGLVLTSINQLKDK